MIIQILKKRTFSDSVFALLCTGVLMYFLQLHTAVLHTYEYALGIGFTIGLVWLSRYWRILQWVCVVSAIIAGSAVYFYDNHLSYAKTQFLLKYVLSSPSLLMWMSVLFMLATLFYWLGFCIKKNLPFYTGKLLCWLAVICGFAGLLVRWYETYLLGVDTGYIPVSNLYEVCVLFCVVTALFYLYYEQHYQTPQLGGFVLLIVTTTVLFLYWYASTRNADAIVPLVPALQSWWMKIHVPANFIGYGAFALAAMVGLAYVCKAHGFFEQRLPSLAMMDDLMYKAITIGFTFFTLATVLGAFWAAQAWGGYWSWDPKETWALIVWLNYAAWLHMRLIKGLRGNLIAWWAVVGLLVTSFAFLGVNIFLSGLHSYGQL